MVGQGVGVALMGDDIHSIHVQGVGDEPVWQLRFYERPLEDQVDREQFDPARAEMFAQSQCEPSLKRRTKTSIPPIDETSR